MKFIITESKFENVVFKYLDNQDFIKIDKGDRIYFANSDSDEYAQIRYDKDDGWCFIYYELINEISSFFSLGKFTSKELIGKWVENIIQIKVLGTSELERLLVPMLKIPN